MSFRTPMKNSSPLANYSFTTPTSSSSSSSPSQNDTFVQKTRNSRSIFGSSNNKNNDLIQLAALNNLSTPKKNIIPSAPEPTPISQPQQEQQQQQQHFFNTPVKLEPLVESPFKLKRDAKSVPQQQIRNRSPQPPNTVPTTASATTSTRVSQRSLFNQEPGRFQSTATTSIGLSQNTTRSLPGTSSSSSPRTLSFEPVLDDNVIQAMQRLQNKEFSMRRFVVSAFALLLLQLINSLVSFVYYHTTLLDWVYTNWYNAQYVSVANYAVVAVGAVNLVTSLLKLSQKQDQCLDLSLSNEQRKLLGLELVVEEQEEEEQVSLPQVQEQTPAKQVNRDLKEMDTISKTNELLSRLNLSTPRK